jgi:ribonuclease HI
VICDAAGEEIYSRGEFVGRATNNVAEYRGLIAAARQVAELGGRSVTFRVDSQLLQRQVAGQYRVKAAHLKPLHAELMAALRQIPDWSVEHVRREHNRHADALVNQAMNTRGVVS